MIDTAQPELDFSRLPAPSAPARQPNLPDEVFGIIGYLSRHCRGAENASSAATIGRFLGLQGKDPGRKVRSLVARYMPDFPFMVSSVPGRGFFVTEDPDDLTHWERTQFATVAEIYTHIRQHRRLAARHGFTRHGTRHKVEYSKP